MAGKDDDLLDTLSQLPHQLLRFTLSAADEFGQKCDELSLSIRENLSQAEWLPPSARPSPPVPVQPPSNFILPLPKGGYSRRLYNSIYQHQGLAIGLIAFIGTGGFLYYQQRRAYLQKRRARRGPDGTKTEVVLVAGNPSSPVAHGIMIDLERRGFVVYITANSSEEEIVRMERKKDLHSIKVNFDDPFDISNVMQGFAAMLETSSQNLRLAGVLVVPDLVLPPGPVETATLDVWSEVFNTRLLQLVALTQGLTRTMIQSQSRLLVLTPTITSSLHLPFHGLENTVIAGLEGLTSSLRAELRGTGVGICNIRLGNLHIDGRNKTALARDTNSEILSWPKEIKDTYGQSFMAFSGNSKTSIRGSPLRELHNTIFDIVNDQQQPWSIVRVGRGSLIYPVFGKIVPRGLISWLIGV